GGPADQGAGEGRVEGLLYEGFHAERKLIKVHIQAVGKTTQVANSEELCWLAIAATAWLPQPKSAEAASP
ncbi:MAG: hypothetical protein ACRDN0_06745, partial [Trebonia sp.]